MNDHFKGMAVGANWTVEKVTYRFGSRDDTELATNPAHPTLILLINIFLIVMILIGLAATIIEMTRIGDIPNLDYKRFDPVAKFVTIR
jgi:hypothetical protein